MLNREGSCRQQPLKCFGARSDHIGWKEQHECGVGEAGFLAGVQVYPGREGN